MPVQWFKLWKL